MNKIPPYRKLTPQQVRDLSLVHHQNLDAIAKGAAGSDTMQEWAESVHARSRVAELVGAGAPEMADHLEVVASVVDRFKRTGKVGFSGQEYQRAKDGVSTMDQLAEMTTQVKAIEAIHWSAKRCRVLA